MIHYSYNYFLKTRKRGLKLIHLYYFHKNNATHTPILSFSWLNNHSYQKKGASSTYGCFFHFAVSNLVWILEIGKMIIFWNASSTHANGTSYLDMQYSNVETSCHNVRQKCNTCQSYTNSRIHTFLIVSNSLLELVNHTLIV